MIDSGHRRQGGSHSGTGAKLFIYAGVYAVYIIVSVIFLPLHSYAEDQVEIRGLRYHITPEYLRVVIDISGAAEFTSGKLSGPDRLFFDIKNAKIAKDAQKSYTVGHPLVKTIRLGQFNQTTARIVFDLGSADYDFKIFSLEDPARLIIDISAKAPDEKKQLPPNPGNAEKPIDPPKPAANKETAMLHRKIVIDPGHGGHDTGAVGPDGLYEKDVVLDIALRMRDIIKKEHPSYEVVLTRDSDVFIPLPARAQVANKIGADFFLSVHANASPNRKARGIETYLLNWTNDEEALRVAARENAISVKKMKQVQSELGVILASLERDRKRDGSLNLAGNVQRSLVSSMRRRYPKVADLGVKQALFYVLVDAQMPSALAEVSFISNPEEEKLLSGEEYRQQLAASLVSGIEAYFAAEPQERLVNGGEQQKINYSTNAPEPEAHPAAKIDYTLPSR